MPKTFANRPPPVASVTCASASVGASEDLADRLRILGAPIDRASLARLETRKRGLSVDEAMRLAAALNVAPVHLLVDPDGDEPVQATPTELLTPKEARDWIRGAQPLVSQDPRGYSANVPRAEFEAGSASGRCPGAFPWAGRRCVMRGTTYKRGPTWTVVYDEQPDEHGKRRQRSKGGFATQEAAAVPDRHARADRLRLLRRAVEADASPSTSSANGCRRSRHAAAAERPALPSVSASTSAAHRLTAPPRPLRRHS